jgi:hypothetical protein
MTLTSSDESPTQLAANRWSFPMRTEDGRAFRAIVADDALAALDVPFVDGVPQLEGECRSKIKKIALDNHDAGQDDSVPITQTDIEG